MVLVGSDMDGGRHSGVLLSPFFPYLLILDPRKRKKKQVFSSATIICFPVDAKETISADLRNSLCFTSIHLLKQQKRGYSEYTSTEHTFCC